MAAPRSWLRPSPADRDVHLTTGPQSRAFFMPVRRMTAPLEGGDVEPEPEPLAAGLGRLEGDDLMAMGATMVAGLTISVGEPWW